MANSWRPWQADDERLMWRVRMSDDSQAFARIVERWEKPIHSLCARMTGDVHRAQDLCQDAFTRLFARRKTYEPSGRFSTFLWRIALNLCYDELRRIKRRSELSLDGTAEQEDDRALPATEPSPHDVVACEERASAVRNALQQLAEPYRVVVVLRHYEGLKFREIADVLDIPEGTVKSRMAEALSQLGRILGPALELGQAPCLSPKNEREVSCNQTKPLATLAT